MRDLDTIFGISAISLGSTGLTLQIVLEVTSIVVVGVNLVLALGGCYLLYLRIRRARRKR